MRRRLSPDAMFPAGRRDIDVRRVLLGDGTSLRVAESGDRHAPPVLLLHGWGASIYMWRDWFAPLAQAGFHAIAVDLPGHGMSDKPDAPGRYSLDAMVDAVRELVTVEGLSAPHVVAQSMAGTLSLALAERGEVDLGRLVLVNPAAFGRVGLLPFARHASPRAMAPLLDRVVPRWIVARAHRIVYGDPSLITANDIDEYWAASQFPGYARAMRSLIHEFAWARAPVEEMVSRLRTIAARIGPPLVILGTRDRLVRDAMPYVTSLVARSAPIEVYESVGGGHAVNEERPAEILEAVVRRLQRAPGLA
jgi:pimeloyl-ACP methyl ester carboxylesterase